jgi:tRNA modification GTPase
MTETGAAEAVETGMAGTAGAAGVTETGAADAVLDEAERMGIARSLELAGAADLVLYVLDGTAGVTGEDRRFLGEFAEGRPVLVVWNKADLAPPGACRLPAGRDLPFAAVSAKHCTGVTELAAAAAALLKSRAGAPEGAAGEPGAGPGTPRQKRLVDAAAAAREEALALAGTGEPLDLVAPRIREVAEALGEITGEVSTADILETMFSRFCVGK